MVSVLTQVNGAVAVTLTSTYNSAVVPPEALMAQTVVVLRRGSDAPKYMAALASK